MGDIDRPWDARKTPSKKSSEDKVGFAVKLGAALAVILFVGWCSVETQGNMAETDANGDGAGAEAACRQFVEQRLKSPSTADFSSETATQDSGPNWTVTGIVDSENSFGGTVRNGYRCELASTGDDNWRAVSVETDGN